MKLLDILKEGTLVLTPEERQQVENMIPEIIKVIEEPDMIPSGYQRNIGTINYKFADGEDGEVLIAVATFDPTNARGIFLTGDPNNRKDNTIFIQQAQFRQYFPSNKLIQKDQNFYRTLSGNANTGIERLRQVLKHELIHAKDPALNHHYLKEPYDSADDSIYYKSWAEFQTFTGQFFESLISGTDRVLNSASSPSDIKKIESALANILQFFAGKTKTLSIKTSEFIEGTGSRNIFQKAFNFIDSFVRFNVPKSSDFALSEYITYINLIKQYNPEGYKEFLKDLYKTIKSIEEKVNSVSTTKIKVQEMKSNIQEIRRMQFLAGLITESQLNGEEKENIATPNSSKLDSALDAGLSTLEKGIDDLKTTGVQEESVTLTALGLAASFPGLVKLFGEVVDATLQAYNLKYFITDTFDKIGGDKKKFLKTSNYIRNIGNNIEHWGHDKEKEYLTAIGAALKKVIPSLDNPDQAKNLEDLSKKVYAGILGSLAAASLAHAFPIEEITKTLKELGFASFKTIEAADLADFVKKVVENSPSAKTLVQSVGKVAGRAAVAAAEEA